MRLRAAGGVIVGAPCVSAFAYGPHSPRLLQQLHPQSALRRPRNEVDLANIDRTAVSTPTPRKSLLLCWGEKNFESFRRRTRPWSTAWTANSISTFMTSTSLQSTSTPAPLDLPNEKGILDPLRLVVIGANAGELGLKLADFYGLPTKSMEELMKGRRGRRTDLVKAKAASQWLELEGGAGGVLTGFPTTAAQAQALEKQGVSFEQLIAVKGDSENREPGDVDTYDTEVLVRYEERAMEIMANEDCGALFKSVVPLLIPARDDLDMENTEDSPLLSVSGNKETCSQSSAKAEGQAQTRDVALERQESDEEQGHCSQHDQESIKTPQKGSRDVKGGHIARKDVARAPKVSAELRRIQKEATKRKKKDANEAQRLDTPFYIAVAQGKPKARYRPTAPTIPSRITERISSAVPSPEEGSNTRLEFGPLVLESPASDCLLAAGITEPTGIQQAGMEPILNGENVILHAMTGSGKTLAFLLPLMQRWASAFVSLRSKDGRGRCTAHGANERDEAFRVILALPTRELAVQVAREAVLLAGGVTASVELLVDSGASHDLARVTAPIVVGSTKVLERVIRKSHPSVRREMLSRVECVVVDEVDRLVDVLSKHAPPIEMEKRKRHPRPIAALLERIVETKPDVQVVACSATIGRPLRRELTHIIRRSSTLRWAMERSDADESEAGEENCQRPELRVIRAPHETASVVDLTTERAVSIPDTIRHYCVPLKDGDFFSRLEALAAAVRELQPRRPMIFVPQEERVTAVVAHLRRTCGEIGRRAVTLHEAMGFVSNEDTGGVRGSHTSEAIQQHDMLARKFRGNASLEATAHMNDGDLLAGAGIERLNEGESGALLVTGEDSARGLHFDNVDFVFLMKKPKSPDEYVHLVGRTGRQGKKGSVVSLVSFEESRKLQAWSSTLKIKFEALDYLDVVRQ